MSNNSFRWIVFAILMAMAVSVVFLDCPAPLSERSQPFQ